MYFDNLERILDDANQSPWNFPVPSGPQNPAGPPRPPNGGGPPRPRCVVVPHCLSSTCFLIRTHESHIQWGLPNRSLPTVTIGDEHQVRWSSVRVPRAHNCLIAVLMMKGSQDVRCIGRGSATVPRKGLADDGGHHEPWIATKTVRADDRRHRKRPDAEHNEFPGTPSVHIL